MRINAIVTGVCLLQFLLSVGIANGQTTSEMSDFRIDIDIYEDEKKPPINSLQTIFTDGKYIELDDKKGRVTVVDPANDQITILDSERKALIQLKMADLENQLNTVFTKMTDEERRKFSSDGNPVMEVIAGDNFVTIGNNRLRYKFRPMTPSNPNIATSYGDFANWSVRINAIFNRTPPFIRMQLNQLLIDQRQLPAELRRVTVVALPSTTQPQGKTEEIVARLIFKESLSQNDRTRVATVLKSMSEFRSTTDKEFFR